MTKTVGKKKRNESSYGEIYNTFCGIHKYLIILLDGPVFFVSHLPFKDYSTISTIYKTFFKCKTDEKVRSTNGLKLSKLNSFLEPSLWRTIEFTGEFLQVRLNFEPSV